jgi:HEAT repeat protein
MAKRRSTEEKLSQLRELRGEAAGPQVFQELRGNLRDSSNLVVAAAAELAGAAPFQELAPDLVEAFERFLVEPLKKDKLCRAKNAVVEALNKMEFADESFYLRNVRYVQAEPVWGGTEDQAIPLRVACAFGLVRLRHRGVLHILVDMLAGKDKAERVGAAQALAYSGTEAACLVLRLKARLGDAESEVLSECFTGILELNPDVGIPFVAEFLERGGVSIQEAALIALGSSRQVRAFEPLQTFAQTAQGDILEVAHVALALLRLPAATDFLLMQICDDSRSAAESAVNALGVHAHDPVLRERVAEAVAKSGAPYLRALFEKRFRLKE